MAASLREPATPLRMTFDKLLAELRSELLLAWFCSRITGADFLPSYLQDQWLTKI